MILGSKFEFFCTSIVINLIVLVSSSSFFLFNVRITFLSTLLNFTNRKIEY